MPDDAMPDERSEMSQLDDDDGRVTPQDASVLAESSAVSKKRRLALIGGVPLALLLLLVAGWGIDTAVSGDRVVRNVTAQGAALGGLTRADINATASDLTTRLSNEPATLEVGDTSFATDPVTLGAEIDADALAEHALSARRGGFILARPFRWVGTFFSEVEVPVEYRVNSEQSARVTAELIEPLLALPTEPKMTLQGGTLQVEPGAEGATLEPDALAKAVPEMMAGSAPYSVKLAPDPLVPDLANDVLEVVAAEANSATDEPVEFRVLASSATVDTAQLRSWIRLDLAGASPTWLIDNDVAVEDLEPLYSGLGSDDQQAHFDVADGKPIIIPASETVLCCDSDTADRIKAGLLTPLASPADSEDDEAEASNDEPDDQDVEGSEDLIPGRTIELAPRLSGSDIGVAELEALGIIEEVSSFSTNHKCCQGRVKNIQLMADIVRGYVIRPGERFDLNDVVGRRTSAGGFVAAGAIAQGVLEAQVGGGVSQFTTTIFNASFFAGMDFVEYQSHSLYFSRYPRGREATISWPKPDFIVENNTPYGVLVWPTYSDTSISVTFYSTKNVDVACVKSDGTVVSGASGCDDAVRWSSQGACTRNTTVRQRRFEDGTEIEDSVFAVYRPGEGLDCNGNSTRPTTTTVPGTETTASTVVGETTVTVAGATTTVAVEPTTPPATTVPTTAEGG